ncbi:MAG: Molybdenum cofactor guanylyltransferase [Herbaspirillum frisingense]|uniref:Molybdenum cofactor guanylyltransferase n=1 Tax=Herbaspirillum frisingense TaxID=92645 RepID=A0A7V8FSU8_9BURK|nr:MAG: Molybdenum cofactor guanylyltransferase [Herbaspirillum frisingense]
MSPPPSTSSPSACIAILLAAGRGTRFDASEGKLIQPFSTHADGSGKVSSVAQAAARTLLQVLPVVAVVAEENALAAVLRTLGCEVVVLEAGAARAMSASLRQGLLRTSDAAGWLVALADMPLVQPDTVKRIVAALQAGAGIALPVMDGRRGHPVGFARPHLDELLALRGDQGARALLNAHPVTEIEVNDPGIFADIDTQDDLARLRAG